MTPNCVAPLHHGSTSCNQQIPRFHFDGSKCIAFPYTGCRGNGNNFKSFLSCQCKCKPKSKECTFGEGTEGEDTFSQIVDAKNASF